MSIIKFMSSECLIECMEQVMDICNAANAIRSKNKIRNRQPLANLDIISINGKFSYLAFAPEAVQIIKDECNVKKITIIDSEGNGAFVL